MAGYVIHIAIAQEYLKLHKENNNEEFIKGTIFPDETKNKQKTHYGKSPAYTDLKKFLLQNEIKTSFQRGHFLHLITDYLFYNYYLNEFTRELLHSDYDKTNKDLVEKYDVKLPEQVKQKVFFLDGKPKYLTLELVYKIIDEVSKLDLDKVKQEVLVDNKKWNTYKNLV